MFSLFRSSILDAVACDISRAEVKMLAFSYDSKKQEFSSLAHQIFAFPEFSDKFNNFTRALAALEEFLNNIAKHRGRRIKKVTVSLPDSALLMDMHNFRFIRPNPETAVSSGELSELWKQLEAEAGEKLFPEGASQRAYSLIPAEPEHFSIDGYTVKGEMRSSGKELTIAALVSAWPDEFAEAVEALRQKFPKTHFRILPEAAAIRDYIGFRAHGDFSGIAADIGAEDSTLLLFSNGVLDNCWSFPFGGNDVTRAVAKAFAVSFGDAETLKRQWSQAALDETAEKLVHAAASRTIEFWKHEWGALLTAQAETRVIAPEICLMGGGARLPILADAFSDSDWLELFSSGRRSRVWLLPSEDGAKPFLQSWPFASGGDEVIFSLVSRMIQQEY